MALQLVGTHEIRIRLGGISRQRAHQITTAEGFPKPVATLMLGKVWRADDVEAWIRQHRPPRGGLDRGANTAGPLTPQGR